MNPILKTAGALGVAGVLVVSATAPSSADDRWLWAAGGLAAGALLTTALVNPYSYGRPYYRSYAYAPAYAYAPYYPRADVTPGYSAYAYAPTYRTRRAYGGRGLYGPGGDYENPHERQLKARDY